MNDVHQLVLRFNDIGMNLLNNKPLASDWEQMHVFLQQVVSSSSFSQDPQILHFQQRFLKEAIDYTSQAYSSDQNISCLTWLKDYIEHSGETLNITHKKDYLKMLIKACKNHTNDDCFLSFVNLYYDLVPHHKADDLVLQLLRDGQQDKVVKYMPDNIFPFEEFLGYHTLMACFTLLVHQDNPHFFSGFSQMPQTRSEEKLLAEEFCMVCIEIAYHQPDLSVNMLTSQMKNAPLSFQNIFWNKVIECSLDKGYDVNPTLLSHGQKALLQEELKIAITEKPIQKTRKI